ncbi:hypothetical protein CROQUDRAFT_666232 [Cronartium quercuum f. sp. fusiforme G11]|uniref:DUF3752 domain-containing protein n=1 Tax=Cronartium quercuum f. sp. fusiforme G11 TaxID=708437 RepID=A0A9P6N8B7_9BASI|nr:hypothetical protein CROQUDRAFT_666232 [Cronartium quercuum f. sp. fusiforme G11]
MPSPVAGPSMPSSKQAPLAAGSSIANVSDDSEDDFMPELPPEFAKTTAAPKPSGPIGPTLPVGFQRPADVEPESDDEEQDEFAGPMPLPSHLAHEDAETEGVRALREREERQAEKDRLERESKVLKREEWMLVPPKELDLPASVDPTKIKSRGFKQTSKPHSGTVDRQGGTGSLWTETPAERAQRLEDEAMGKRRRAEDVAKDMESEDGNLDQLKRRKRDREMRKQVEEHNKAERGASLLDLHQTASSNVSKAKTKAEKEKDKKEEVVWDHDSMMGLGGKLMSDKQKADMIRDAKGLGGRFGGGSFL